MKSYYVYIMTNKPYGVLYVGVSNNLERRSLEHQTKQTAKSFIARYNADQLVYYEETTSVEDAIKREKQLKNWHRQWKINLIESINPTWNNLFIAGRDETLKQVQDNRQNVRNSGERQHIPKQSVGNEVIGFVPAGVIFDVDDTLLDNYPKSLELGLHEKARLIAVREIGKRHGIAELADVPTEMNKTIIHRSKEHTVNGSVWQLFYELGLVDSDVIDYDDPLLIEIVRRKHELYPPIMAEFGAPLPKAIEFVKAMYVLTDGHIAIASSAQRRDIDAFLMMTGLNDYFLSERVVSGADVRRSKPDPEVFNIAFDRLGLPNSARQCVVAFEDDPRGIESAKKAGLFTAAITSRFDERTLAAGNPAPDLIARHYIDFAACFGVAL